MRITYPTAIVLNALAAGHAYGFDIVDATGLGAGTVYPILRRLEADARVRSSWERVTTARAAGRPPRRNYRLTASGLQLVGEVVKRYPGLDRLLDVDGGRAGA
ncbi:MAG TPA: helix-turn-helix transcriptional regulator [Longimicrobiales bacterium]|nr:helix-turn-helix transcriptional regulator [Longimicrobiales bacterium]